MPLFECTCPIALLGCQSLQVQCNDGFEVSPGVTSWNQVCEDSAWTIPTPFGCSGNSIHYKILIAKLRYMTWHKHSMTVCHLLDGTPDIVLKKSYYYTRFFNMSFQTAIA